MTVPELHVQDRWRRSAQTYDRRFYKVTGRLYRWREERTIERALSWIEPGSTVLDVACGTGRITSLLQNKGFRATGCDISRPMLDVARQQLTGEVPLFQGNGEYLPCRERSFDAATCIGLFMHLDADTRIRVLRGLARTVRDRFIVQYGCPNALLWAKARLVGETPGKVPYPISEAEMRSDFERTDLRARETLWVLSPLSSSVVVVLERRPRSY